MRHDSVRALLLDMGGVLVPEPAGYAEAARDPDLLAALRALGHERPEVLVRDASRAMRRAYYKQPAACAQPDPDRVLAELPEATRRLVLVAFRAQAARGVYSHARDVVAALARRYRLGLVSNTIVPGDHHQRLLERMGILTHLRVALWSASFGHRKPDPGMLLFALERLDVPPRHALMVGDKLHTDVEAARRARVRSVWLRGDQTLPSEGARPDFVLQDVRELPLLLRRLPG